MVKHTKQERRKNKRHIRIEYSTLCTPAWRSLFPRDIAIYLLFLERYNSKNNGKIGLSIRQAAKQGHISVGTAQKSLQTLQEKGFIKLCSKGSFSQKTSLASEYAITSFRYNNKPPTREFDKWRETKKAVPIQTRSGINLGALDNSNVL